MAKRRGNHEGNIMQFEGGWRGTIRLGDGIRKYMRGKTRGEVQQKIRDLLRKKERNEPLNAGKKTVAAFMADWLKVQVIPNLSPATYEGYESHVRMYITPMLGKIPLERLSGKDVQHMLNEIGEAGLSSTSVKKVNATLKSALTCARKWGLVDRNVAILATPPKQVKYDPHPLKVDQGRKLLDYVATHRYEAMFHLAMLMGLRSGEVVGLAWTHIDFVKGMLYVRQSIQRVKGKGAVILGVKSQKSRRDLPLPPIVLRALLRRRECQLEEARKSGGKWKHDSDLVFTSRDGMRVQPEEPWLHLQAALEELGIPPVRFHDLRHSAASLLLSLKVPMKVIQEILGHSSFQITADIYSHLVSNELQDAMQAMDGLFDAGAAGAADGAGMVQ